VYRCREPADLSQPKIGQQLDDKPTTKNEKKGRKRTAEKFRRTARLADLGMLDRSLACMLSVHTHGTFSSRTESLPPMAMVRANVPEPFTSVGTLWERRARTESPGDQRMWRGVNRRSEVSVPRSRV
jgi:hypothetical protein